GQRMTLQPADSGSTRVRGNGRVGGLPDRSRHVSAYLSSSYIGYDAFRETVTQRRIPLVSEANVAGGVQNLSPLRHMLYDGAIQSAARSDSRGKEMIQSRPGLPFP